MIGGMSGVERDVIPYGQVMGDRARLTGLNIIGMQRRGFSRDDIQGLRNAYQLPVRRDRHAQRAGRRGRASALPGLPRSTTSSPLSAPIRAARSASRKGRMADNAGANQARASSPAAAGCRGGSSKACRAAGRDVFVLALEGEAEPETVARRTACLVPHRRGGEGLALLREQRRDRAGAGRRRPAAVARGAAAGLAGGQVLCADRLSRARR